LSRLLFASLLVGWCCPLPSEPQAETPSRKELELFLKEVQTLAKLHHRNIVQFYGACLEMGSMFFVTELMKVGGREGSITWWHEKALNA
jgi:hypothetical protein